MDINEHKWNILFPTEFRYKKHEQRKSNKQIDMI